MSANIIIIRVIQLALTFKKLWFVHVKYTQNIYSQIQNTYIWIYMDIYTYNEFYMAIQLSKEKGSCRFAEATI